MHFKKPRLGPQLVQAAQDPGFFDQVHVIYGGTGAVGGATALQMISLLEEAATVYRRATGEKPKSQPRIVITGRTHGEIRQFTTLLFEIQKRDHGALPRRLNGVGYRTVGGVVIELTIFSVDPSIRGLEKFSQKDEASRVEAIREFLTAGGLSEETPTADKLAYLEKMLKEQVGRPFSRFLEEYSLENYPLDGKQGGKRFRSAVVSIPLASVAAYKLTDLEYATILLGAERHSPELDHLKDQYLKAIRDDLAYVVDHQAETVLAAHTTAVGGMYDEHEDGSRVIRLGFAHSGLDDNLRDKQTFAERLAQLYSQRGIKMLITAAAIGVDAVLVRKNPPMNGAILRRMQRAAAEGHACVPAADLQGKALRVYRPLNLDMLDEEHEPVELSNGRPLMLEYVLKSGENGYFTVPNTDALYRVMRVTSSSELGLLLGRTALFGDDQQCPSFVDNVCYYTETDNSRQVFDLLGQPQLRQNQLKGLEPKALQDLGSAKHQAELHTLGLLILIHRLRTLDFDAIPPHVDLQTFGPKTFFEDHSRRLTLEYLLDWNVSDLARDLVTLVTALEEADLKPLKSFFQADPDRQQAAHRVLQAVLQAVWSIPSLGSPIVYQAEERRRVVQACYAASIDQVLTHRDSLATYLRQRFDATGGGDEAAFERLVEFHIAGYGFVDLRPIAVLVTARSEREDLEGRVQIFDNEADFTAALNALEPYSYFTTSGLIALLARLKGLCRWAHELDPHFGSANEFRVHIPHDERGRPLLVPGVVEAFRMVSEGLEKNTGAERLDGRWGYHV